MIDYQMMSRFVRGFSSLMHADKPTVAKIHGYCVAGGTDIALHADQVIAAADAKIGYPPTRVWGVPAAGCGRTGSATSARNAFCSPVIASPVRRPRTGDLPSRRPNRPTSTSAPSASSSGSPPMPVNQLIMAKLALNTALLQQGVATSRMVSTVFDGVARHTPEGHAFVAEAREHGFREAVEEPRRTVRRRRPQDVRGLTVADAPPDDGALGGAERAARRTSGVGHRERTHPSHSGFRHQGADAAGRADPDGQRGGPGALRGRLPAVRPAARAAATPGRRHQPAAEVVGRHLDDAGDHQRRHRCTHPRRITDHVAAEQVRRAA